MPSPKPNITPGDVNVINGAELMTENGSLRFVVGLNALASGYDANGNMILRLKDGARYFLAYDAENRLTSVSGTVSAHREMASRAPDAYLVVPPSCQFRLVNLCPISLMDL